MMHNLKNNRIALYLGIIIFLFAPQFVGALLLPGNPYLPGTHAVLSECITAIAIFMLSKVSKASNTARLLGIAFLFCAIADVNYMLTVFLPNRESFMSVYLSEIAYSSSMLIFLVAIASHFRHQLRSHVTLITIISLSALIAWLNIRYILTPYFSREPVPSLFYKANGSLYAFLQTTLTAMAITFAIRANTLRTFAFFAMFFMLFVGDFGIRYQTVLLQQPSLMGFEYAWQTVMAGMAVLFAVGKKLPENTDDALPGYFSIRAILAIAITLSVLLLFGTLVATGLLELGSAFQLTNVLLVLFFVFAIGNGFAMFVSHQIISAPSSSIRTLKATETEDFLNVHFEHIKERKFEIFELREIIGEFNTLTDYLNKVLSHAREQSKFAAIASTTQMVAHDVRRPFSMMQNTINIMKNARTMDELQGVLKTASKDIDRATLSVNGLLTDIMEIGSPRPPQQELTRVDTLVKSALTESFKSHPAENIRITHNFSHTRELHVDTRQVQRVFLNILGNAIQALGPTGEIWVETRDHVENESHRTLFALGNNGPKIPDEHVPRLFESFFTKGKKGGTGLGLAIAHKVVTAHGGKIWYENVPSRGIQFCFTLPTSNEPATPPTTKIPSESAQFLRETQIIRQEQSQESLAQPIKPMRLAVVDDDAVFLMVWELADLNVHCDTFLSPEELIARINSDAAFASTLTAIVTDFHFDNSELDGISLAECVAQLYPNTPVYICTNTSDVKPPSAVAGVLPKDAQQAIAQLAKQILR